jgi:iron complex outermembrane receptor protein
MTRRINTSLRRAMFDWGRGCGISALAVSAGLLAPYAVAQQANTTVASGALEEVVVSGVREALKTSQDIKKEADTVVDSITASDIGAFPDKSVAEALQRVTGITVSRFAAPGDSTHFSAEPSGVIIRGLPQVRSEFNGRDSFNANSSRGLSFSDVSPELMAGVDTYKNITADMIEGGIAGTVNLRTHVPFDSKDFVLAMTAEAGYGDLTEEVKPAGSVLISDRWTTGIGEFGLMGNVAYSHVVTQSQGVQLNRFFQVKDVADYGGGTKWLPGGVDLRDNTYDRVRTGAALAAQWRSPDASLLATLQYNRSKYENDWEEYALNAGIGNSQTAQNLVLTSPLSFAPAGTPAYEFDSRGVFRRGVLADSGSAWVASNDNPLMSHPNGFGYTDSNGNSFRNWFCYTWAEPSTGACPSTRGVPLSAETRSARTTNLTEDTSLHLQWTATERLTFDFDLQYVDSDVVNFDNSANSETATNLALDLSGGKPRLSLDAPTGWGFTPGGFADPANYYHEWVMEHAEDSHGEQIAGRIDMELALDAGWADSVQIGVRRADRDQEINWSTYNWGSVQPFWGVQNDVPFFLGSGPWQNTYQTHTFSPNLVGGGVFAGGTFIHPSFPILDNYQRTIQAFGNGNANSWVPLGMRTNCQVVPGTLFCPVEMQDVSEDSSASYMMFRFGGDLGRVTLRGNVGVRYVRTTVGATGGVAFPVFTAPTPSPGDPVDVEALVPADDLRFMNGATAMRSDGASHENWLPSLNLRFGLSQETFVRFAASRALARPDMGLYKNYVGIGRVDPIPCLDGSVQFAIPGDCTSLPVSYTPQYTADAGNPRLPSTTADQLDLTYEWYFAPTGSVTAAIFYKRFNDYIQYGTYTQDFTNNGVTRKVTLRAPITGDGASIRGFEVAYQGFLDALPSPWNGFGFQANFTYVDNQGIENANLTTVSGAGGTQQDPLITFTKLPLADYSKTSYNLVAMYDKEKFSARLAWNWREKYLVTQSDCCIKLPIWADDYGQLDASVHYRPSASLDLYAEAQNVTQEETVLFQQVTNDGLLLPRSWFLNDRRFQVGLRYRIQ